MINTGQQDGKIQWSRAVPAGAGDEGMEAGKRPVHWRAEVAVMQENAGGGNLAAKSMASLVTLGRWAEKWGVSSNSVSVSNYTCLELKPCNLKALQPFNIFL